MKLALIKIKKCWAEKTTFIKSLPKVDKDTAQAIYDEILKEEAKYTQQEDSLKAATDFKLITIANKNLRGIEVNCLNLVNSLSTILRCEPTIPIQAKPKILDKLARPGAMSLRPIKKGTYEIPRKP